MFSKACEYGIKATIYMPLSLYTKERVSATLQTIADNGFTTGGHSGKNIEQSISLYY